MITRAKGVELILGAKQDPVFGAVVMVGMGGVTAELMHDRALELPPLNEGWPGECWNRCGSGRCWPGIATSRR